MNMFWGDRFGKLLDPFGHSWSIATHIEDVPPDEMERRGIEEMKKMAQMPPSPPSGHPDGMREPQHAPSVHTP
jgi:hypothetical protein